MLTTDERTYFVDVLVNDRPEYQSAIAWHYPVDDVRLLTERGDAVRVGLEKGGNAFTPANLLGDFDGGDDAGQARDG